MNSAIIYSSITGNTRKLAEAVASSSGVPIFPVRLAPDLTGFDFLGLGFWVRKGMPDSRMLRFMEGVRGKKVFFFATMGTWPDSPHARSCLAATRALLEEKSNVVTGHFHCQGRVNPRVAGRKGDHHPMTEARRARLEEAAKHPDEQDLQEIVRRWEQAFLRA